MTSPSLSRSLSLVLVTLVAIILLAVSSSSSSFSGVEAVKLRTNDNFSSSFLSQLASAGSSSSFSSRPVGGWLSANSQLFQVLTPAIINILDEKVRDYRIPNISTEKDSIDLSITDIKVSSFELCPGCVQLSLGTDDSLHLSVTGLSLDLTLAYRAKWHFIHSSGHCNPKVSDFSLEAKASFGPTLNGKPQIMIRLEKANVGKLEMNCKGLVGHIVDAIADVLKHFLATSLIDNLVGHLLTEELNKKLQTLTLNMEFLKSTKHPMYVDFSVLPPPSSFITSTEIHLATTAVVTPAGDSKIVFPFSPPAALIKDSCSTKSSGGNRMVAVGISSYTLMTAFYSLYHEMFLSVKLDNVLTTSEIALVIPGFEKKLGAHQPLNLSLGASAYPIVSTVPSKQALSVTLPLNVSITSQAGGGLHWILSGNAVASVSVTASSGTLPKLFGKVEKIALQDGKVVSSNVGSSSPILVPVIVDTLDLLINKVLLKPLDDFLAKHGFPLPKFEGFQVSQSVIEYNLNSICVASNLIPPAQSIWTSKSKNNKKV